MFVPCWKSQLKLKDSFAKCLFEKKKKNLDIKRDVSCKTVFSRRNHCSVNNLPNEVKLCTNLNTFKNKVKEYFLYKIRQKDNDVYLYD